MKTPWYYADRINIATEKHEIKDMIEAIQNEAWNSALDNIADKSIIIEQEENKYYAVQYDTFKKLKK